MPVGPDEIEVSLTYSFDYLRDSQPRMTVLHPWGSPATFSLSLLPTNSTVNAVEWSPNGEFLVVGADVSPYVFIFQRVGRTFTKLPNPALLPDGPVNCIGWSPDGTKLVIGGNFTGGSIAYARSEATFIKWNISPPMGASSVVTGLSWSPNGEMLALINNSTSLVVHGGGPLMMTGRVNIPAPGSAVKAACWSPDGTILTIATQNWPFVVSYKRIKSTSNYAGFPIFERMPDSMYFGGLSDVGYAVKWSPNGKYLALGGLGVGEECNVVYRYEGHRFFQISYNSADVSTDTATAVAWTPNSEFVAFADNSSTSLRIFQIENDTLRLESKLIPSPATGALCCAWSPSTEFLAVGHSAGGLRIYQTGLDMPEKGYAVLVGG